MSIGSSSPVRERTRRLADQARAAQDWLAGQVFPLWAERGLIPGAGFVEALTLDAAPTGDTRVRVRVQARQVYVFAEAARLGWEPDRAAGLVEFGIDTLLRRCRRPDGLIGTILDLENGLADDTGDLYDTAFAIFALAWACRTTGAARHRAALDGLIAALDDRLAHPAGGYAEAAPARLPRRQNPHMHLYEAFTAACAATGETAFLDRADAVAELMRDRWLAEDGLIEFFDDDWRPADGPAGERLEPGHMFEWAWLLARRAALTDAPPPPEADRLHALAMRSVAANGFVAQTADRAGRPLDASRRAWPQTEAFKAHLARFEAGCADSLERACALWDAFRAEYIDPAPAGGWIDCYDAEGRPMAKDIPASTGYHIVSAISEMARVAARVEAAEDAAR